MKALVALRGAGAALVDLLLPAVCPGCHSAAGPLLCPACLAQVPRPPNPCPWCGAPRRAVDRPCAACSNQGLPHLRAVQVGCVYHGLVETLVGDAKAGSRPAAVRALTRLMPETDAVAGAVVAPIPPARGRRPGPHLATALARALARRQGLSFRRLLTTSRIAAEQHRLTFAERRANVAELFTCAAAPERVILVDDLITSGATASAAAAALRAAGARHVDMVCLARVPRKSDPPPIYGTQTPSVTTL